MKWDMGNLILGMAIAGIILLYISPLPGWFMDFLLVFNLSLSLLILFVSLTIKKPSQFTVFPTILLISTLFRLGLNISTTRLILGEAQNYGLEAAGKVIAGFGSFVAGNNALVGIVIFSIILVVQFFVITKGADRISEVAARFMLDGLPGKQMSIGQDLNAGLIKDKDALNKRAETLKESYFHASMDGAMKFIKGDAIASLLITVINIIGGLGLGILYYQMPLLQASTTFTKLTIGDGLVSALPALLNAVTAGIIITRVAGVELPAREIKTQMFSSHTPLLYTAAVLFVLLFTPLPKMPLVVGVVALGILGMVIYRSQTPRRQSAEFAREKQHIEELTQIEPVVIEIGYNLVRLIDESQGGQVGKLIMEIRRKTAEELGIVIPPVSIRDNLKLPSKAYRINIRGTLVAEGKIYKKRLLAVNPGQAKAKLKGVEVSEPILGFQGCWIKKEDREKAESGGYQILTPAEVLSVHFRQATLENMDKILTRQEVLSILDRAKKTVPDLVSEIIPDRLSVSKLKGILQELLMEQVPISDIEAILEVSGENSDLSPLAIAEAARGRLASSILPRHRSPDGNIRMIEFTREAERQISEFMRDRNPKEEEELLRKVVNQKVAQIGPLPLLCSENLRRYVRDVLWKSNIRIPVFGRNEVRKVEVEKVEKIYMEDFFVGQVQHRAG